MPAVRVGRSGSGRRATRIDDESSMIICLCRRLTDRHISQAIANGIRTPRAVFAAADCRPQCGSCLATIRAMMAEAPECDAGQDFAAAAE
jgi:bacterioferritin-associated ferredoxin